MNRIPSVSSQQFDLMSVASEPAEDAGFVLAFPLDDFDTVPHGHRRSSHFSDVFAADNHINDEAAEPQRRRSSAQAVQDMLNTLVHPSPIAASTTALPPALSLAKPMSSTMAWRIVVETPFEAKYYRNDRKNLQCFPQCTASVDASTGQRDHTNRPMCRDSLVCRAFPEHIVSDWAALKLDAECVIVQLNDDGTSPESPEVPVKGLCTRQDRFFEVRFAPHTWRYAGTLPLKKLSPTLYQVRVSVMHNDAVLAVALGPTFQIGATKALQRAARKREAEEAATVSGGAKKLIKHVVGNAWPLRKAGAATETALVSDDDDARAFDLEAAAATANAPVAVRAPVPVPVPASSGEGVPAVAYPDLEAQQLYSVPVKPANKQHAKSEPVEAQLVAQPVHDLRISIALILWLPPFGFLGLHHVYLGRTRWAWAMALTLNMLLLGWVVDAARLPALVFASNASHLGNKVTKAELFYVWLFLGLLGGHHYLAGNVRRGLLYTFTLGLFGIGWLSDVCRLDALHASM